NVGGRVYSRDIPGSQRSTKLKHLAPRYTKHTKHTKTPTTSEGEEHCMTDIISAQTEATAGGIDALTGLLSLPAIKNGGFANPGDKLVGVVAYDVTDDDVTPAMEFGTSEVKRDRNGRIQYKMCVTLDVEDWTDTDLV